MNKMFFAYYRHIVFILGLSIYGCFRAYAGSAENLQEEKKKIVDSARASRRDKPAITGRRLASAPSPISSRDSLRKADTIEKGVSPVVFYSAKDSGGYLSDLIGSFYRETSSYGNRFVKHHGKRFDNANNGNYSIYYGLLIVILVLLAISRIDYQIGIFSHKQLDGAKSFSSSIYKVWISPCIFLVACFLIYLTFLYAKTNRDSPNESIENAFSIRNMALFIGIIELYYFINCGMIRFFYKESEDFLLRSEIFIYSGILVAFFFFLCLVIFDASYFNPLFYAGTLLAASCARYAVFYGKLVVDKYDKFSIGQKLNISLFIAIYFCMMELSPLAILYAYLLSFS